MKRELPLVLMCAALLVGCGDESPPVQAEPVILSAQQAQAFATSCAVCHSHPGSTAPLAGKIDDWEEGIARGLDGMLQNTLDGYRGMPPLGGCAYCTEEDLTQLIRFMSGGVAR